MDYVIVPCVFTFQTLLFYLVPVTCVALHLIERALKEQNSVNELNESLSPTDTQALRCHSAFNAMTM